MTTPDRIRQALQTILDEEADGWSVPYFVVAMGIERLGEDGAVEAAAWYYSPPGQAEWMTTALLNCAIELRQAADATDY